MTPIEVFAAIFILLGVAFILLAGIGALRFQDALTRMAAVSKASTLGLTLLFIGIVFAAQSTEVSLKALLIIVFLWLSGPIAAHLLGRAALLNREKLIPQTKGQDLIPKMKS